MTTKQPKGREDECPLCASDLLNYNCRLQRSATKKAICKCREIVRAVIWKIAQDEGGHILHYNEWVDDNWVKLKELEKK